MNLCCCHEVISNNFCDLLSDVEWGGVGTHFAGRSELNTYVNFFIFIFVKVIIAYNGKEWGHLCIVCFSILFFIFTSATFIT